MTISDPVEMNKFVSLLRGINVSGQKIIKMDDLRTLFESLGFKNVITYIQSGNVIFESSLQSKREIKEKTENGIEDRYGFHVHTEIRTEKELEDILINKPFDHMDREENGTKFSVSFLSSAPLKSKVSKIQKYVSAPEKIFINGREAYFHCPNGFGRSKLTTAFLEKKLDVKATARNWKTVNRLFELM